MNQSQELTPEERAATAIRESPAFLALKGLPGYDLDGAARQLARLALAASPDHPDSALVQSEGEKLEQTKVERETLEKIAAFYFAETPPRLSEVLDLAWDATGHESSSNISAETKRKVDAGVAGLWSPSPRR